MKKLRYFLTMVLLFLCGSLNAFAKEELYSIDIHIKINDNGSAHIEEIWDMKVEKGTEIYKPMQGNMAEHISNFTVRDETGTLYTTLSYWDIDASLSEKKNKCGINDNGNQIELCWGKGSYGKHTWTFTYDVANFIHNVENGQIIYWKLVNDSMSPAPQKARVVIEASQAFEDTLPVWGYGYKGYAYVSEGKIYLESENGIDEDEYMVLYATFPANTFQTTFTEEGTTEEWLEKAEEGSFAFDYSEKMTTFEIIMMIISIFFSFIFPILIFIIIFKAASSMSPISGIDYGTLGKKIDYKNLNYFRDIPCKKDIYRAYFVATIYSLNKKKEDFLGSIFLKWLNEERISMIETPKKLFRGTKNSIDLKIQTKQTFSNPLEQELYTMLKTASEDGILETKEFEKWCSKNYSKMLSWFDKVLSDEKKQLTLDGSLIEKEKITLKIFKTKTYETQLKLKEEAEQLAGLKKFLVDFSDMKNKEAIEVHLWKEYLMYAQIFGIADKVAKQFKNLYPDLITDVNYDSIIFVNHVAYSGVSHAQTARSRAESYSSGGGGFSSGGGGGGSFGGGSGGGSR